LFRSAEVAPYLRRATRLLQRPRRRSRHGLFWSASQATPKPRFGGGSAVPPRASGAPRLLGLAPLLAVEEAPQLVPGAGGAGEVRVRTGGARFGVVEPHRLDELGERQATDLGHVVARL